MKVNFSNVPPPIYHLVVEKFGEDAVSFENGTIFTYGNTIHARDPIPKDWLEHEMVHVRQQEEMGAKSWWAKYLEDPTFRFEQELEAYRAQAKYLDGHIGDDNQLYKAKLNLARYLSSSMYGNIVSTTYALQMIDKR